MRSNYAFVAEGTAGLEIINIANPAAPVSVAWRETGGNAQGGFVRSNLVFLADGPAGLTILRLLSPEYPYLVGSYGAGNAQVVFVLGDRAYVAYGTGGLQVFSVSAFGYYSWVEGYSVPGDAITVQVSGDYAYVHTGDSSYPQVVNVGPILASPDPTVAAGGLGFYLSGTVACGCSPTSVDTFSLGIPPSSPTWTGRFSDVSSQPTKVQIVGALAYVADKYAGLVILDLSNPALPVVVGRAETGAAVHVKVANRLAVVGDRHAGVQLFSTTNAAGAVHLGTFVTPDFAGGVDVAGNRLFVADWQYGGVQIADISNPATPVAVGSAWAGLAADVQVVGSLAFMANGGISVLDVANPAAPRRLVSVTTTGFCWSVTVASNLVYAAAGGSGLQIFNAANPTNLVRLGGYDTAGASWAVQVQNGLAYVADGSHGLEILDVPAPTHPKRVGGYDTPCDARGVHVVDGLALLQTATGAWRSLTCAIPLSPSGSPGTRRPPGRGTSTLVGTRLYFAADTEGLIVLDVLPGVRPLITPAVVSSNSLSLSWPGRLGVRLQRADNLTNPNWQDVPGSAGVSNALVPFTGPSGYFRLFGEGVG